MSEPIQHGSIIGGVVAVPDLEAALADYHGRLGFALVERGVVPAELAASWGIPGLVGKTMAMLQPTSGAHCFIRLIEQPLPTDFVPTTTYGWASYEITVQKVFGWPGKIAGSAFEIIGPPKEIPGLPYFVAMQVHGSGKEVLYFNETRSMTPSSDLPFAQSPMDHIFIVILAAPDRAAAVGWYRDRLKLDVGDTYTIAYSMINNAFGLPDDNLSSLTMVQHGRMPIVEIDDYPAQAKARRADPGCLPPGNSLVTLMVDNLDALALDWISPPTRQPGPLYNGARAATVVGPAGELLELVELAC
ncbi:MAG: VOC family protein [Sphingopyxis sp.]|nr:VOC family protein [Sphingopyxis sp.]